MARVNIVFKDESNQAIETLIGYGSKEKILGMVIDDWVEYCLKNPDAAIHYLTRKIGIEDVIKWKENSSAT